MDYLEDYYGSYDEEGRLLSRHGSVEYITTQKYIHEALAGDRSKRILEIGAGTAATASPSPGRAIPSPPWSLSHTTWTS